MTNHLPTIEKLYLLPVVKKLTQLQNGLVPITGPMGSGKTTTMAALDSAFRPRHRAACSGVPRLAGGAVPFDGDEVLGILVAHVSQAPVPPRNLEPAIPADLAAVILCLLAKQPEASVQSCCELALLLTDLRDRPAH